MASAHVRGRLTLSFCVRHNCSINCSCKMLPGCLAEKGSVDQHRAGGGSHDRMGTPGTPGTPRWKLLIGAICPLISQALTRKLPCGSIYHMKTAPLNRSWTRAGSTCLTVPPPLPPLVAAAAPPAAPPQDTCRTAAPASRSARPAPPGSSPAGRCCSLQGRADGWAGGAGLFVHAQTRMGEGRQRGRVQQSANGSGASQQGRKGRPAAPWPAPLPPPPLRPLTRCFSGELGQGAGTLLASKGVGAIGAVEAAACDPPGSNAQDQRRQ